MDIYTILGILSIHWLADFVFQDEKWALGKSKNWGDLLAHTTTYSLLWVFPIILISDGLSLGENLKDVSIFVGITFVFHTITDYITSRIVSERFKRNHLGSKIPNLGAYSIIGFDQLLHYIQLFLTYKFLFL